MLVEDIFFQLLIFKSTSFYYKHFGIPQKHVLGNVLLTQLQYQWDNCLCAEAIKKENASKLGEAFFVATSQKKLPPGHMKWSLAQCKVLPSLVALKNGSDLD